MSRSHRLRMARLLAYTTIIGFLSVLPNANGQDDSQNYPVEPVLAEASDEGETAIGSFKIPDGWTCELFAAEPDVANPVAIFIDGKGRVFVCESYRQNNGVTDNRGHDKEWLMADLAAKTVQDRIDYHRRLLEDKGKSFEKQDDRIRLLLDKDRDGKVDESVVFANHFHQIEDGTGAGVLVRNNEAYYTCIPKLWKLTDADGDGQAEGRTALSDGYGVRVAFRGHDMHGLTIGPDGRLYFSIGDRGYHVKTDRGILSDPASGAVFRCELDGSQLEVFATGLRNPQELAFDDYGRLFTGDNNSDSGDKARWVYVVRGGDSGWRMYYQYHPTRGPFNPERIWHPFHADTPAYIIPPVDNIADGPSGLTYFPGTGLDASYTGTFFLCDFRGQASNSGLRAIRVKEKGAFFETESNEQLVWNMLVTDADFGPDGALYISDWVNGWNGEGKGRIYRVFDPQHQGDAGTQSARDWLEKGMNGVDAKTLSDLLTHPDRRVRMEAQWKLAADESLLELKEIAQSHSSDERHRLHGVWGLGQIARKIESKNAVAAQRMLAELTEDSNPRVAMVALQMLAESGSHLADRQIIQLIGAKESVVRYEASMAAGALSISNALDAVCQMLIDNNNADPIVRHGGIMAMAGQSDLAPIAALSKHPSSAVRLAAAVALRKRIDPRVRDFLFDIEPRVALEAARAINDLPELHGELPKLASTLKNSMALDPWARRALNAHYRLGLEENALAIADIAADSRREESLRLVAVEMLANWKDPKPLDWVTNNLVPLDSRSELPAKKAIAKNLVAMASSPNDVRTRALEVASKLGIEEVGPLLSKVLDDQNSPGEQRASALRGLVSLSKSEALPRVLKLTEDKSPAVRIAATDLLAELDPKSSIASIQKMVESGIVSERQAAWDTLKKIDLDLSGTLLEKAAQRYLEGSLPPDCRLNVFELVQDKLVGPLAEKVKLDAKSRRDQVEANPLAAYADCLEGGDFLAGRDLFFNRSSLSCVRCHKVVDKGGEVGPALTDIGSKKERQYLLEAIVAPNLKIADGFQTIVLATDDDEVFTGILKSEDDELVQILNADGLIVKVAKESIIARKPGLSSMPPDLTKYLNDRELRDLIAYLAGLDGKNPRALIDAVGGHAEN